MADGVMRFSGMTPHLTPSRPERRLTVLRKGTMPNAGSDATPSSRIEITCLHSMGIGRLQGDPRQDNIMAFAVLRFRRATKLSQVRTFAQAVPFPRGITSEHANGINGYPSARPRA